ncbi:class I SAM-dependent methyltransferase [Parahaliea mediterranea]|uniref:Class I SAM-dependent methyltransferase n=1 Tax=Parahaliea mediterranea TaxID=651086 RepID=A0A939DF10_9GAMM|nr:class I SAM-dependent methyltransferase [Parahaliea mediterranea]MBN7796327.1 class I SAM-dependent methyltransferase [Parahaliea mediterranea]
MSVNYDTLAADYVSYRVPDPRIEAAIRRHISPGDSILNVGAGQGAYEPDGFNVVALEPSREMIARRSSKKAPTIQGMAERLPFKDDSFDTALGVLTLHHWQDIQQGLSELKRVTRGKIILLTWNGDYGEFWLPDYLPEIAVIDVGLFPSIGALSELLGGAVSVETIAIPHDCTDGFMCAYWRRPEMYLDASARQAMSMFSMLGSVEEGLIQLSDDLEAGYWHKKYQSLLGKDQLDCGYRLVVCNK